MNIFPYILSLAILSAAAVSCTSGDGSNRSDTSGTTTTGVDATGTTASESSDGYICTPGKVRCSGQSFLETCAPTGMEWMMEPCGPNRMCVVCDGQTCAEDHCEGACERPDSLPSSAGCSFIANRSLHGYESYPDGLVVGNPNATGTAHVQIFEVPAGTRKEVELFSFDLKPGQSQAQELSTDFVLGDSSMLRSGGMFRVHSDLPVIACQHAPLVNNRGNESSLLLPEDTLGNDYVVVSYPPSPQGGSSPSYFEVVAIEDATTVEWTPPVDTAGNGLPIPFVPRNTTGKLRLNRFDTMRIVASANFAGPAIERDVSGTILHADKPIWVVGATRCAEVPHPSDEEPIGKCDQMQEVLIPLKQWGRKYVAAAAPVRGNPGVDPPSMGENHYWRVYAASPDTSITATPDVSNSCPDENGNVSFPISLETRGDYVEFCVAAGTNFVLESDKPFMPVEYIQSQWSFPEPLEYSAGNGDPSMVQMVPVDQYLGRYTFITGVGFAFHYLQVIRAVGNAHVMLDGTAIDASNFVSVGDFEVATVEITEGAHEVVSDDTFGIIQVGYASSEVDENSEPVDGCINPGSDFRCNSSYAYPGGMGTEEIFVP